MARADLTRRGYGGAWLSLCAPPPSLARLGSHGTLPSQAEKSGVEVRRGGQSSSALPEAKERESWQADAQQNVSHVVLTIHGIGQRLDLVRFASDVRSGDCRVPRRIFFHSGALTLIAVPGRPTRPRSGGVSEQVHRGDGRASLQGALPKRKHPLSARPVAAVPLSEITPKDLKDLRDLVNMTVVDAAMYMTGRHQATLLRFVRQEMNHIFATFGMASWRGQAGVRADDVTDGRVLGRLPRVLTLASAACAVAASSNGSVSRNPRFLKSGGRVSILGHSLGSVIAFDVLSSMHASAYTSLSAAEADDDPAVAHVCAALATCGRGARRPRSPC